MAALLTSAVVDDWNASPAWVSGLALAATVVLVASAIRIFSTGAKRKRVAEGPRTRIVISEITPTPPRPRSSAARR